MHKAKIAILGFGTEGKATLSYLKKHKAYKNASFTILDVKKNKNYLKHLSRFDTIFRSPGIPYLTIEIQKAEKNDVEISSATKLFFSEMQNRKGKIIGVTGTKGKGITSTLLYQILKSAGYSVLLGGNIGKPMIELLPRAKNADFVILELSSFQLQDLEQSPDIAIVLDIFPDHLDSHKDFKEYFSAKANIARHQKKTDMLFYFGNNEYSRKIAHTSRAKKYMVRPSIDTPEKNYEMVAFITEALNIPKKKISEGIKEFKGLPYRLQKIHTLKKGSATINFYNDSAATNPEATAAAIRFMKEPTILIVGGKDKNIDYKPLAESIKKSEWITSVILIGETTAKIKKILNPLLKRGLEIKISNNLKTAIDAAYESTQRFELTDISLSILFSPGASSFDMFENYVKRGEQFTKLVKILK